MKDRTKVAEQIANRAFRRLKKMEEHEEGASRTAKRKVKRSLNKFIQCQS